MANLSTEYDTTRDFVRRAFVTGIAVTLPLVVTLIVLGIVVNFISQQLNPIVGVVTAATGIDPASEIILKFAAIITLLALVFVIGAATERQSGTSEVGSIFETLVSRIPGIGSLYRSLDEMSRLLLDSDTDSFREVKLVEFPVEGSYSLAFLTADTPDLVQDATDHEEMVTLFLPMAPNPVMGGYVLHVSEDRVFDVEMSVEEGIQSIVTSGVATGHQTREELPEDIIDRLNRRLEAADIVTHIGDLGQYAADVSSRLEGPAQQTVPSPTAHPEDEVDNDQDDTDQND